MSSRMAVAHTQARPLSPPPRGLGTRLGPTLVNIEVIFDGRSEEF